MPVTYLQKFGNLPDDIRQSVGSSEIVKKLNILENKYGVDGLSVLLIKIAVREIPAEDIESFLVDMGIPDGDARKVAEELLEYAKPALLSDIEEKSKSNDATDKDSGDVSIDDVPEVLKSSYLKFLLSDEVKEVTKAVEKAREELIEAHGKDGIRFYPTDKRFVDAKKRLYDSINRKDKARFLSALAEVFLCGDLKSLFGKDERYVQFWRKRILKQGGFKAIIEFDANPSKPEYLGQFIRYVMEKRFDIPSDISVLWGVYLSAIAHSVNDAHYEYLAYGDVEDNIFVWNV